MKNLTETLDILFLLTIGVRAGGAGRGGGGLQPPQNFGATHFLGSTRNLGKAKLVLKRLACVCVFFFSKRYFLFQPEVGVVNRLDFHRLSGPVFDLPLRGDECGLIFPDSGW